MPGASFVPSTVAPTHMGRFRSTYPLGIAGNAGGKFLPDVFPAGRQLVEAAFGYDTTSDPTTWVWTDITRYCQWDPGVDITLAFQNEQPDLVPAKFTVDLRNDQPSGGDFTLDNAMGRFWPNVVENVPIRAGLDIGNGYNLCFQGEATSWTPTWDVNGQLALVTLLASGVSRRIRQGTSEARSAMRRFFELNAIAPDGYWPLEDSANSVTAASALTNGTAMTASGGSSSGSGVEFGVPQGRTQPAYTGYDIPLIGTAGLVSLAEGGSLTVPLPQGFATRYTIQFTAFSWAYTGSAGADLTLARWTTGSGTFARYEVRQSSADGGVSIVGIDSAGSVTTLLTTVLAPIDEFAYAVSLTQNGSNIDTSLYSYRTRSGGVFGSTGNDSRAGTLGPPIQLTLNPNKTVVTRSAIVGSENQTNDIRMGHVGIWYGTAPLLNTATANATNGNYYSAWNAWKAESATDRLIRLCAEQKVPLTVVGSSDIPMGPQPTAGFLDLIKECAAVDGGLLFDGLGPGFTYIARTEMYSQAATLTLNAAGGGDVLGPAKPDHTDSGRVNTYTANSPAGSSRIFRKTDGALGTKKVGLYDDSGDHNTFSDNDLSQIAAAMVGRGTVGGINFPRLKFELAKPLTSLKAQAWLNCRPSSRIDAIGVAKGTNPDRRNFLRGWNVKWNSKLFTVTANLTPYDGWRVSTLANPTGDTQGNNAYLGWLEVDTVTTLADLNPGDSSVLCAFTGNQMTNPNASTYADDLTGLYVNLDGLKIGVTGISVPSGNQQVVSVNTADVLRKIRAGSTLIAWDPVVPGM